MIEIHVTHDHYFHSPEPTGLQVRVEDLEARASQLEVAMSVLSDKIAEVNATVDAEIVQVQNKVATLETKIAELQALVDQGLATPDDIAALDALKEKIAAIDPTDSTTLPPEENPPA